jgi:hypothetical protein
LILLQPSTIISSSVRMMNLAIWRQKYVVCRLLEDDNFVSDNYI